MRIIEKKCPNCGASLSFDENDKSCKCDYCKRAFEIERDLDDVEKFNLIYDTVSKPFKLFSIIPFVFASIFIIFIALMIFLNVFNNNSNSKSNSNSKGSIVSEDALLHSIEEIENFDYSFIDTTSTIAISGEDKTLFDFHMKGSMKRETMYLLYNDKANRLIPVYKVIYSNGETTYNLYVPVIYNNIHKESVAHDIGNPNISAPIYYFNMDHSEYAVGYDNLDKLYEEVVKPLENEFTLSK